MKQAKTNLKEKRGASSCRWALIVFGMAVALSAALSLASESLLSGAGTAAALLVLAAFIGLGILFDVLGMAVASADPRPFHSMASHREKGARQALFLIRNASRVSRSAMMWWEISAASFPARPVR